MLCCKCWMQLLSIMAYEKLCDLLPFMKQGMFFMPCILMCYQWFQGNICPKSKKKKTTTDGNLLILCKACWAWMMWQGIIYGWLHLNWICSPFTSFLPFTPPMFSGSWSNSTDVVIGQKDPSFVFFLKFYGVDLGLGPPVAWLCLSSIFTVLARAQKWQLWSPRSQFTTP